MLMYIQKAVILQIFETVTKGHAIFTHNDIIN